MIYSGPERRRHRVYVTRNTEYHMRDNVCVGVRSRIDGTWARGHQAIGQKLIGGWGPAAITQSGQVPEEGARLFFTSDLLTSPLEQVERPAREITKAYPLAS